ncbi:MAG: PIN domain-containing protein [Cyanobacteria bacterium J06628_6]
MPRIYLDVCCFNRPFGDQKQERIRLETEAILLILNRCNTDTTWQLISSQVIDAEIAKILDDERRQGVQLSLAEALFKVDLSTEIVNRAVGFQSAGIKAYDALHIACAESGQADAMLTTDDRLIRRINRSGITLGTRVVNPVVWVMEMTEAGEA